MLITTSFSLFVFANLSIFFGHLAASAPTSATNFIKPKPVVESGSSPIVAGIDDSDLHAPLATAPGSNGQAPNKDFCDNYEKWNKGIPFAEFYCKRMDKLRTGGFNCLSADNCDQGSKVTQTAYATRVCCINLGIFGADKKTNDILNILACVVEEEPGR